MSGITDFKQLFNRVTGSNLRKRAAVVWASDSDTQVAACNAVDEGLIDAVFVGCKEHFDRSDVLPDLRDRIDFVEASDPDDAAAKAVALARSGEADMIIKGMINSDNLLRAVLNRETGITPRGSVLTHVTAAQIPPYGKILFFSDPAVIPYPTLEQRVAMTADVIALARKFGVEKPRVALVHCSEKVDERHFPFLADYLKIKDMASEGYFGDCIVDGPLDVKTACDPEALKKKHIDSPIAGEADALIFPDIEAGNVFYKTITLFGDALTAGMLFGPDVPVLMTSRGDPYLSKISSIAMAAYWQQ